MMRRISIQALLCSLCLAMLSFAACAASERSPVVSAEERAATTPKQAPSVTKPASGTRAVPAATAPVAARTRITHELVPFATSRAQGTFHRFRIPLERARVSFVDLAYQRPLVSALDEHDLVINGGYWAYYGTQRKIQGLLVINGQALAPQAKNLSGGVLHLEAGRARLLPSGQPLEPSSATLAIQCNPRLVYQGRVIPKLDGRHLAARTALCVRAEGRVLDAYLTADDTRTSLAELGDFLLAEGCQAALNLDGGPSTAAVFRADHEAVLTVGSGLALPYGLGFVVRD